MKHKCVVTLYGLQFIFLMNVPKASVYGQYRQVKNHSLQTFPLKIYFIYFGIFTFYNCLDKNYSTPSQSTVLGKTEGRRPLGRPRRRWVDNIRMDLQELGCGYMDCIGLAQDRDRWRTLVSAVMNLGVP